MHVCDTWSFSAISRVVLLYNELYDPNRLLLWLARHQFQLDDQNVFRLWVKNHQNEICQINFNTVVLLRLRRHKQHITFCEFAMSFSLCENKKAKYDDNVPFDFSIFQRTPNENYATDQKTFFIDDSWIANYQITKCVLHLDYASKPKNSIEAIYEWNPQLLSCQPNIWKNYFLAWEFILIFTYLSYSSEFYLYK